MWTSIWILLLGAVVAGCSQPTAPEFEYWRCDEYYFWDCEVVSEDGEQL